MIYIIINPHSAGGAALRKYKKLNLGFEYKLVITETLEMLANFISALPRNEKSTLISASGDGGVNYLINYCIRYLGENFAEQITIGAIGLGSSNDFHKPIKSRIGKIPVRIDSSSPVYWDLGKITWDDQVKYFAINASIGITAEGNHFYNTHGKYLKQISFELASFYAIVNSFIRHRNREYILRFDDNFTRERVDAPFNVSNFNILKKKNISGSMNYDTLVLENDGNLDLALGTDMSRWELLKFVISLLSGKFSKEKTHYWQSRECVIESASPFIFEADGEVLHAKNSIKIEVLKEKLKICS